MSAARMSRRRHRGIALVETIIVTPLLLFLILATAEITNAFVDHNTLTKSVRNGARYLAGKALLGTTGNVVLPRGTLVADTQNLVVYGNTSDTENPILPGLAIGDVSVTPVGSNDIEVSATYSYTGILGSALPAFGLGSDIGLGFTLQATVTMKAL